VRKSGGRGFEPNAQDASHPPGPPTTLGAEPSCAGSGTSGARPPRRIAATDPEGARRGAGRLRPRDGRSDHRGAARAPRPDRAEAAPPRRHPQGSLAALRLKDFDLARRRVRIQAKGGKVRNLPLPTEDLRAELAEYLRGRDPREHLLFSQVKAPRWQAGQISGVDSAESAVVSERRLRPMSAPALHRWWYGCLERAGIVDKGVTSGVKMHTARYTAGTEFYLRSPRCLRDAEVARATRTCPRPSTRT
jgi:integrase